jgi:predicted nucleic acid-binding protein
LCLYFVKELCVVISENYVLDTSALLAYIENEPGTDDIDRLLQETLNHQHTLYISVISGIEVFYITYQEQGITVAQERLQLLEDLPLIQESVRPDAISCIGAIKATHTMSFADCCIAGLSKEKSAVLVHKDPEFEQLEGELDQLKLPYKRLKP